MGDEVKIKVIDVDFERRRPEFRILEKPQNGATMYKIIRKGKKNNESDHDE